MTIPEMRRSTSGVHIHEYPPGEDGFSKALVQGLSRRKKRIPFRFLYDEMGSRLFDDICRQPEYYPTRTEEEILEAAAGEIAALAGERVSLVELGSGAGRKVQILLDALSNPLAYTAIDISRDALLDATRRLAMHNPGLDVHAVWADFSHRFPLPVTGARRSIGFFPGSSIGNYTPRQARRFLESWRRRLGPKSHMIIGVDLVKPASLLERAYDDEAGVTARFSRNILTRANREAGATFDLARFRHVARYDETKSAVHISLVSLSDQTVTVSGTEISLHQGEEIHVESSFKYSVDGFACLSRAAGYDPLSCWIDREGLFSVHYLRGGRGG